MTDAELVQLLRKQIATQNKQIEFLENTVANLNKSIEILLAEIKEQNEKLNKNSSNSSKPPSSDGPNKPKTRSLRQKSEKKPGGQKGHKGANLEIPDHVDNIIEHYPEECKQCPNFEGCKGTICHAQENRYVIDLKIGKEISSHTIYQAEKCPLHAGILKGAFPIGVNAAVQYGTTVKTFIVSESLNGMGADKIARTSDGFFGLKMSTGTIVNTLENFSVKLDEPLKVIKEQLINSEVNNYDETGVNVCGKNRWAHSASNLLYTFLTLSRHRGEKGIKENGVIEKQHGVAVHDCWQPYWKFENVTHALCCVHLLRELNGIIENYPKQKWAREFKDLLEELYRLKVSYDDLGRPMESCYRDYYGHLYDNIMKKAREENPLPETVVKKRGKPKKTTPQNLIDRLDRYKEGVLLFTASTEVPFSNNIAEQSVRNTKVKLKNAGCFRSEDGAKWYLRIRSYIDSARKHGVNTYEAIRLAFLGTPNLCLGY